MADSKNDIAWYELFENYNILNHVRNDGKFVITSECINQHREARLMTKFDHSFQRPKLFAVEKLSILPISRGEYVIAPMNTFCSFHHNHELEITDINLPSYIESLNYNDITSEAMAINCAYVSGIINDFSEDVNLLPTVNGRMSSRYFDFTISLIDRDQRLNICVNNSQIEIDGGYEGLNSLNLIEAKNRISSDFLIRQLYYPYRLWNGRITKKVRLLFLTYTNGIFYLREYQFEDDHFYNSINLIREKKYRIKDSSVTVINTQTIEQLINEVKEIAEPTDVPFPQADSFERIINLCEVINSEKDKLISRDAISSNYEFTEKESFDSRQVDYYTNAAIYLGFIAKYKNEEGSIIYALTDEGKNLFCLELTKRQLKFAENILSHFVFNKALSLYFKKADAPTKTEIVSIMKSSNLNKIESESTFERRASTIIAWINWIIGLIEE